MDIELLKTFLEVGKTRHFGKAADNLFITQAAVSARVKQLETLVGAPLFTRIRNNIQLTLAGEKLTKHAEEILLKWEIARLDIARQAEGKDRIVIGASAGLWSLILQRCLNFIHKNTPNHTIKTTIDSDESLYKQLLDHRIDIAFCYEKPRLSDLINTEFLSFELRLVSTLDTKNPGDLLNNQYIYVDWGKKFKLWHVETFGDINPPVLETCLADIALEFILKNNGSAFIPYELINEQIQKQIKIVDDIRFNQYVYVVYNKHSKRSQLISDIIESLQPKIDTIQPEVEYPVQI